MNEIQNPDISLKLARAFGLRAGVASTPTLAPEVQPVVIVSDINSQDQEVFTKRLCAGTVVRQPGAGLIAVAQILNPSGSGVVVTLTGITHSSITGATLTWLFEFDDSPLANEVSATQKTFVNRLLPGEPVAQLRHADAAGLGTQFFTLTVPSQLRVNKYSEQIILGPGMGLRVSVAGIDQEIEVNFAWEEKLETPFK